MNGTDWYWRVLNGPKRLRTVPNSRWQSWTVQMGPKQSRMVRNTLEQFWTVQNIPKQSQTVSNGPELSRIVLNVPERASFLIFIYNLFSTAFGWANIIDGFIGLIVDFLSALVLFLDSKQSRPLKYPKQIFFSSPNKCMSSKYNKIAKPSQGQHQSSFHLLAHSNAGLVFLFAFKAK